MIKWQFLTSTRFWSLVLIAAALWLKTDGYITAALADFISTVGGGFIVIRTTDRFSEKMNNSNTETKQQCANKKQCDCKS